jgi:hypothetical protein
MSLTSVEREMDANRATKHGAIKARFLRAHAGGAETGCFDGVNLRCKRTTGSCLAATAALSGS